MGDYSGSEQRMTRPDQPEPYPGDAFRGETEQTQAAVEQPKPYPGDDVPDETDPQVPARLGGTEIYVYPRTFRRLR